MHVKKVVYNPKFYCLLHFCSVLQLEGSTVSVYIIIIENFAKANNFLKWTKIDWCETLKYP